jgi:hypothetical protein
MMMEAQIAIAQSSVCRVMVHLIVSGCIVFFETEGNVVSLRRDDNSWSLRLGKRLQWANIGRRSDRRGWQQLPACGRSGTSGADGIDSPKTVIEGSHRGL